MISAGIFGASGYAGLELLCLLEQHGGVRVDFVTSDRFAGKSCASLHPGLSRGRNFMTHEEGLQKRCDVVFLATPPEASKELVPKLAHSRIVDLSNAFRHHFEAAYGLLPWFCDAQKSAQLIANPGCYASAAILALAPLFSAHCIEDSVIIDAASGTTGAGRRASEDYSFSELHDDVFAYRVLRHQHTPEIALALSRIGDTQVDVTFTAKLLPVRRGILATAYARLKAGVSADAAKASFDAYAHKPFFRLAACAEEVRLRRVVGTNDTLLAVDIDAKSGRVVVCAAIDNLLKGASGQALENMNLAFSLPQTQGLGALKVHT